VKEILETAFGVLEGMNAFGQMPDSIECILDTANLKKSLQEAWDICNSITSNEIADCIRFVAAFTANEIQYCGDTVEEAETLVQLIWGDISNGKFDEEGIDRLISNYKTVSNDLADAISSYDTKAWVGFGLDFGQIFGLFLDLPEGEEGVEGAAMTSKVNPDIACAVEVTTGVIDGLGLASNFSSLPTCVQALVNYTEIILAVEPLIKNGSQADLLQAMILLGNSINQLKIAKVPCEASLAVFDAYVDNEFTDMSHITADAKSLLKLLENYPTTFVEIQAIITYYNLAEWENMGNAIGKLLRYFFTTLAKEETSFINAKRD